MGRPGASPGVIVGFDHHSDEFNLNERAVNADLRIRCPVAWNEKYGGFWYVSSYDAVEQVPRDGDTFAHKYEPNAADGVNYQGEMGVNSRRKSYRDESQVYLAPVTPTTRKVAAADRMKQHTLPARGPSL
jgi:cytochrome P450